MPSRPLEESRAPIGRCRLISGLFQGVTSNDRRYVVLVLTTYDVSTATGKATGGDEVEQGQAGPICFYIYQVWTTKEAVCCAVLLPVGGVLFRWPLLILVLRLAARDQRTLFVMQWPVGGETGGTAAVDRSPLWDNE